MSYCSLSGAWKRYFMIFQCLVYNHDNYLVYKWDGYLMIKDNCLQYYVRTYVVGIHYPGNSNEYQQLTLLWRNRGNHPWIIIKHPPYLWLWYLVYKWEMSFDGFFIFILLYIQPLLHLFFCLSRMSHCQLTLLVLKDMSHTHQEKICLQRSLTR